MTAAQAVLSVARKRSSSEQQWLLSKKSRKAAKQRFEATSSAVQLLAVERHAVINRLDRQQAAAEAEHKNAKRSLSHAEVALRWLSEGMFNVKE